MHFFHSGSVVVTWCGEGGVPSRHLQQQRHGASVRQHAHFLMRCATRLEVQSALGSIACAGKIVCRSGVLCWSSFRSFSSVLRCCVPRVLAHSLVSWSRLPIGLRRRAPERAASQRDNDRVRPAPCARSTSVHTASGCAVQPAAWVRACPCWLPDAPWLF